MLKRVSLFGGVDDSADSCLMRCMRFSFLKNTGVSQKTAQNTSFLHEAFD